MRRALVGGTDEELARELNITSNTVKKRWRTIYDRVVDIVAEFFAGEAHEIPSRQQRGAEKRRRLLHYLRGHPEELRPAIAPKVRRPVAGVRSPPRNPHDGGISEKPS